MWGEPPPSEEGPDNEWASRRPPARSVLSEPEREQGLTAGENISREYWSGQGSSVPLEEIEASIGELMETAQRLRASTEWQETLLVTLEALESRISRMEKGLFRSLEYLESRISAAEQRY